MEASTNQKIEVPIMLFSSIKREGTCEQQEDLEQKVQSSSMRNTRSIKIQNHPLVNPQEVDVHSSNDIRILKRSHESMDTLYTVKTSNQQKRRALNHDVQYPMILEEHHNDTKNKLDTCNVLKTSSSHVPNPLLPSHYIPCDHEEKVNSCFIPSNNRFVSQSSITSQNYSAEKQSLTGSMSCRNLGVENSQFDKNVHDFDQDSDDDSNALWDFDFLDEWDDFIEKQADSKAPTQNL
ncbi:predicted protein [Chaetoceros tenuissimus]|uniref:Uncharacterized protein n=1 Tax=Chaetoceros tenuissimus TaxID=426638 RepID=A0AAD3H0E8_9STRA|nr:predicted protein [Chaetoceros tenuissimus]